MDLYIRLYEATEGKIQESKIMYYCWKWIYEKGVKKIVALSTHLEVHDQVIKMENIFKSMRTLEVHIIPSLTWDNQFQVIWKKLHISITKLINTDINSYQATKYYNAYIIKSVYFGYGIFELIPGQEKELKRLYEEPLLIKLGLSQNFLWKVLYSRKSALGIGIMKPSSIINILRAKLYLGNKRKDSIANEAIKL